MSNEREQNAEYLGCTLGQYVCTVCISYKHAFVTVMMNS